MASEISDIEPHRPLHMARIYSDECRISAEGKAGEYFQDLNRQVAAKMYAQNLTQDFQVWQQNHIHRGSFLLSWLRMNTPPDQQKIQDYVRWLERMGKLDHYLERSVSYIFMRDLGKALDSADTHEQIHSTVQRLKDALTIPVEAKAKFGQVSFVSVYRWAQQEGVESTLFWLLEKLKGLSRHLPKEMPVEHAQRKVIKIIAGVLMHESEVKSSQSFLKKDPSKNISLEERSRKLDETLRVGYAYGLTYPLIDDLLDSNVLSSEEKNRYSTLIRTALRTGEVPELEEWNGMNQKFMLYIHSELSESFETIKARLRPENRNSFFEQANVFFNAQEVDRRKSLSCSDYTNEALYIPVILKSSYSRLIARSVLDVPEDIGFDNRTFYYGIYNQLADDFADLLDDYREGRVTPYSYYFRYHEERPDLINPYEMYWTVISYLIHNVYHSDPKTREVILARAINGLKRFKERVGTEKYNEIMELFASAAPEFNAIVQKMVHKADDVDFLDKLLRDQMITLLKREKEEQEAFADTVKTMGQHIDRLLTISETQKDPYLNSTLIDSANYSLEAGGKHVRALMAWDIGVNGYGLAPHSLAPLLRALEYMHTASLIFDDLPSQDNANTRRGKSTLHVAYNIGIAELTGLFLTQKAVEELTSLNLFDPQTVLSLIQYVAHTIEEMCKGQVMDLEAKGKRLTLEQLKTMVFYKTSLAFEASLVMPALLAQAKEPHVECLKRFARHAGIVFQIKDDLLDAEGDSILLGKQTGKDEENKNSTFVTLLGLEGARKEMWEHYCEAMEALKEAPCSTAFLKQMLHYLLHREK